MDVAPPAGESPRTRSLAVRAVAAIVLIAFAATVIITSAVSLGRYCITTDAGDERALMRGEK